MARLSTLFRSGHSPDESRVIGGSNSAFCNQSRTPESAMTISSRVRSQLFENEGACLQRQAKEATRVIRLPPTLKGKVTRPTRRSGTPWTSEEHDRFLKGLEVFPTGPWKDIAAFVGTRTPRQTMTHAQKYRQKIERNLRGLKVVSRKAHAESPASPAPETETKQVKSEELLEHPQVAQSPVSVTESAYSSFDSGIGSPFKHEAEIQCEWTSSPHTMSLPITINMPAIEPPHADIYSDFFESDMTSILNEIAFTDPIIDQIYWTMPAYAFQEPALIPSHVPFDFQL